MLFGIPRDPRGRAGWWITNITVGDPIYVERDGKWYRVSDGEEVNLVTTTLSEFLNWKKSAEQASGGSEEK